MLFEWFQAGWRQKKNQALKLKSSLHQCIDTPAQSQSLPLKKKLKVSM
jgi:hypothetical protein